MTVNRCLQNEAPTMPTTDCTTCSLQHLLHLSLCFCSSHCLESLPLSLLHPTLRPEKLQRDFKMHLLALQQCSRGVFTCLLYTDGLVRTYTPHMLTHSITFLLHLAWLLECKTQCMLSGVMSPDSGHDYNTWTSSRGSQTTDFDNFTDVFPNGDFTSQI